MKFRPDFRAAADSLRLAAHRFPVALLAFALNAALVWTVGHDGRLLGTCYAHVGMECLVAACLSLFAGLLAERRAWPRRAAVAMQAAALATFAIRLALDWSARPDTYFWISTSLLATALASLSLWTLDAPPAPRGSAAPRAVVAAAIGLAVFACLMLGCLGVTTAVKLLVTLQSSRIEWVLVRFLGVAGSAGALAALLWLSSPRPSPTPVPVRSILRWLALPVLAVYLAVLLAYFGKCVVLGDLPRGEIATLAAWAGSCWLLLLLLAADDPSAAVRRTVRWLALAILPIVALQITAVSIRVGQYGLTPPRAAAFALAALVAGAAVGALARDAFPARGAWIWIALVALFAGVSPWNVADLGHAAPVRRLAAYETRLADAPDFSPDERRDIMALWDYTRFLERRHGHWRRALDAPSWYNARRYTNDDGFKEKWGFPWRTPYERNDDKVLSDAVSTSIVRLNFLPSSSPVPCLPAASVRRAWTENRSNRIVLNPVSLDITDPLFDAISPFLPTNSIPTPLVIPLSDDRWLLFDSGTLCYEDFSDGTRNFRMASCSGWLFSP